MGRGGPAGAKVAGEPSIRDGDSAAINGTIEDAATGPAGGRGAWPPPVATPATSSERAALGSGLGLSEEEAWTVLAAVDGLGPVTFGALLRAFGTARGVLASAATARGPTRLVAAAAAEGLRMAGEVAEAVGAATADWPALRASLAEAGVVAITAEEAAYPRRLREIEVPPPVLFVRGEVDALQAVRSVALVGTRRPTEDGRRTAAGLASAVAAAGAVVVSGLAVGIDGAAHAGALAAGGRSVAVLGSGHARLYPAVHAPLAADIVRTGGAVIAELPPNTSPTASGFPRRNRIIAGLADATVVVEAGERSGALITASWALEQGRSVFAVPGPLDRRQSVGCNRLLRAAGGEVRIVAGADELIEDLGYVIPLAARSGRRGRSGSALPDAGAILARLGPAESDAVRTLLAGPTTADGVAAAGGLAPATVLAVLTRLEAEGLVEGVFGRYRVAGPLAGVRLVAQPAPPTARDK